MTIKDSAQSAGKLLAYEAEIADLRKELRTAQRAASKRERQTAELVEAVYAAARSAMLAHGPAARIAAPLKMKSKGHEEMALLHLTDWQLGKKSSTFSIDMCQRRIGEAVEKTIQLTDLHRSNHVINECHVMLGGDMVENIMTFPGQAWEVEASLYTQLVTVAKLIETSISTLLGYFHKVSVWEEIGNHGRIGRKGEVPHGDNIDRIAYTMARQAVVPAVKPERLDWHPFGSHGLTGSIGTNVTMGNYKPLLVHGDEIKSFGGATPAFGILRKVTSWATGVLDPFTDAYMGHFHTPMDLTIANANRIFITGSPESDNGYAKEFMAATGKPSQRLHFVDPEAGRVTAQYHLWLT